jgi:transglutaminase-like putative cysteine protease
MIKPPHVPGTWSGDDGDRKKAAHAIGPPLRHHEGDKRQLARPQIVKRATSNQNETVETKPDLKGPSVKRAALNRDNSLASNRLKAAYLRDTMNKNIFDSERELRLLPGTLERQASLKDNTTRPKWLSPDDRLR